MKRYCLALCLVLCWTGATSAAEKKLTADEIADALTGNTVEGLWGQTAYKSYFDPSGFTLYQPSGRPPDRGKWRVDGEADRYCSHWERTGWSCYDLYREGDEIIWQIPGSDTRYSSKLLQGDQL